MFIRSERSRYNNKEIAINNSNVSAVPLIKVLRVHIDEHMKSNEHVSSMSLKAGGQINALQRLHKYSYFKSWVAIYKSFIRANFNYCPPGMEVREQDGFRYIEKIRERMLGFIHNNLVIAKRLLLEQSINISIRLVTTRCIPLEILKFMNGLTPSYSTDLFEMNINSYDLRGNKKLFQPRFKITLNGLCTIRYNGAHVSNMLPVHYKDCVDAHDFRKLLFKWHGPNCSCSVCMQARQWNINF